MLRVGYYARAHVRASFSYPGICWMHRAEIWCVVRPIKYAFDTARKWMISTSAQVQPSILLKTHLFASAGLSPKRRLTRVIRR